MLFHIELNVPPIIYDLMNCFLNQYSHSRVKVHHLSYVSNSSCNAGSLQSCTWSSTARVVNKILAILCGFNSHTTKCINGYRTLQHHSWHCLLKKNHLFHHKISILLSSVYVFQLCKVSISAFL